MMSISYASAGRFLRRQLYRLSWSTTQRRWTTGAAIAGFAIAAIYVPGLGIASGGGAFAGWWLVVGVVTLLFALIGNRLGIGREKAELIREAGRCQPTPEN